MTLEKLTQKDRVLTALRWQTTCGTDFLRWGIPRYAARIHELRGEGWIIERAPCRLHNHESVQWMYRVVDHKTEDV